MRINRCRQMPAAQAGHTRSAAKPAAGGCTPPARPGQSWREQSIARAEPGPRPIAACSPFRYDHEQTTRRIIRREQAGDES